MARIRSIKPEFFTSETLARVSQRARLTFIGLWTYVDDNGVAVDNERLITAALYPLEYDFMAELEATADDLKALNDIGVIRRYTVDGRRYLYVTNWDEHQRISHPGKPRYPLPTSGNNNPPETLRQSSGASPETLRPEQGAGSREEEQGAGSVHASSAAEPEPLPLASLAEIEPGFADFWNNWPRKSDKAPAEKAFAKAIKKARATVIVEACRAYAQRCREVNQDPQFIPLAATWLNKERWNDDLDAAMPLRVPAQRSPAHQAFTNPTDTSAFKGSF